MKKCLIVPLTNNYILDWVTFVDFQEFFAIQFGDFIEIETSYEIIVIDLKIKVIPSSYSISLSRIEL